MRRRITAATLCLALAALPLSCSDDAVPSTDDTPPAPLAPGQAREVELRYLALEVRGFDNELTLEELQAMPRTILADVWLADLDISQLMVNSLDQLGNLSQDELEALGPAAQNMQRLLVMTPDDADLSGTSLEELLALAPSIGIPPAKPLADLLGVGVTDPFIPSEIVAEVMLRNVVGSHPNAQFRRGPVDAEHPTGQWPVAPNSLPLTLVDVVTSFEDMAERFGPFGEHPGFVSEARGLTVVEDGFAMHTFVNANALPYKGADLGNASVASVNSIGAQIETAHDYSDPNWMSIEGLVPNPSVSELTFTVFENDGFIAGGDSREPLGQGNSPGWDLPEHEFERVILEMGREIESRITAHCDEYELGTGAVAFRACVDEYGWVTMETFNGLGNPPPPGYLHDMILEIAQARLHDGGIPEGEADVALSLRDVEVGVDTDELIVQARENLEQNPEALREFASLITDSTVGDADLYYVRVDDVDWLYFVTENDLRLDDEGRPVRDYAYDAPGFFSDPELTTKVSSTETVGGDSEHEKLEIVAGDVVYVGDDDGQRYEIRVGEKPSRAWVNLQVTRLP